MKLSDINFQILKGLDNKEELKTKVKYIYHISDIHIHLYKRHNEYKQQFEKVYKYLDNEKTKKDITNNTDIEMITVITGDILHSKSDLSPECIDMTYNFIKSISQLMPVIIIPGNHDLNMNNKNRLDSISPILADLPTTHPVYYLQHSGVYIYSNLVLMHASIFDYHIIPIEKLNELIDLKCEEGILNLSEKKKNNLKRIALYHGRVNGCELFNGTRLEGEITEYKKTITPNDFNGYDMGLCGDIHLHQNITEEGNVAYAGSLIQQNLGETLEGHGIMKWTVKNNSYVFKEVKNDYGYITFNIVNGELTDKIDLEELPKNIRIRILYDNTTQSQIEAFLHKLKEHKTVLEYNIQNSALVAMNSCTNYDNDEGDNEGETTKINKVKEIDVQDLDFQNGLIEEIIMDNYEGVEESDMKEIKELNEEINKLVQRELALKNKNLGDEVGIAGNRYKLSRLEFSNLYSYGENNVINFKNLNGVVGIIAPNHMGKSAIIDIILYALFDKFPRKGTIKDIVNIRKKSYSLKLIIECGHYEYTIEKSGKKNKASISKAQCNFYRRNMITNEFINLAQDNIKNTREYISKYFGHYEDITNTNFSIQTEPTGFIDAENNARRKELERILRFDYIELIVKKAGDSIRDCRTIISHLQSTMPPEKIKELQNNILNYQKQLEEYSGLLKDKQVLIDEYNKNINSLNQKLNLDVDKQIEICLTTLDIDNVENISNETVELKLEEVRKMINNLDEQLLLQLQKFIKLCRKGVIQRLDVPNKDDILEFCDDVEITNITGYKKLIKSFIKEYKKWEKDQNIVKQVKLQSLNKQIRLLEKKLKTYKNKVVNKFINENDITKAEIMSEFDLLLKDLENVITTKEKELKAFDKVEKDITSNKKKITKVESKIKDNNAEILNLTEQKMPESLINMLKSYKDTISTNDKYSNINILDKFNSCLELLNTTKSNKNNGDSISNDIEELIENIKMIKDVYLYEQDNGFISWVSRYISTDEEIDNKILEIKELITKEKKKIIKYEGKIEELEDELEGKSKLLKEIEEIKVTIKQVNIDKEVYLQNIDILDEISNVEKEKLELEEELSTGNSEALDYIDKLETLWNNITYEIIQKKDLELELLSLEKVSSGLDELLKQAEQNDKLQDQIMELTNKRNNLLKEFNSMNNECQTIRDKCSLGRGTLEKMIDDCKVKSDKEHKLELLTIYKKALSIIPMILINKVKPVLSRKVNDLLSVVTNFNLEFNFEDNKVDIYLTRSSYEDKHILINNSSGFERFISSLAIRLSLMEISKLPSPNVMIIDEGWSCFDNENLHNLDVILDHLGQRFDFILTISHLQIIRQHCDIHISLNKDDKGFSMVNFS